jgi:hypothetical protein
MKGAGGYGRLKEAKNLGVLEKRNARRPPKQNLI